MRLVLLSFVFLTCLLPKDVAAQTVVVDTNILFGPSLGFGSNHVGTIIQDLLGDHTSVEFDYDGNNLSAINWNVDEESDWYVVGLGDVFGSATIGNGDFTPIFTTDNPAGPVFVGDGEFYLGVATNSGGCCRDVFGWVRLQNVLGELQVVENAVAYGSQGIIVGTVNTIPEPAGIVLGSLALGALGLLSRRR